MKGKKVLGVDPAYRTGCKLAVVNEMGKMIEKDVISKLMHRCKRKMQKIHVADFNEEIDGRLQNEQHTLREDMRTYIRMHYDLKEEIMKYFLEYL